MLYLFPDFNGATKGKEWIVSQTKRQRLAFQAWELSCLKNASFLQQAHV